MGPTIGLHADYVDWLEDGRTNHALAPHEPISRYRHNLTGDAHLKRQVMGREAADFTK